MVSLARQVDLRELFHRTLSAAERKLASVSAGNPTLFGARQRLTHQLMLARICCGKLLYLKRWSRENTHVIFGGDINPCFLIDWPRFRSQILTEWSQRRFTTIALESDPFEEENPHNKTNLDMRMVHACEQILLSQHFRGHRLYLNRDVLFIHTNEFSFVLRNANQIVQLERISLQWPGNISPENKSAMKRVVEQVKFIIRQKNLDLVSVERLLHGVVLRAKFAFLIETIARLSYGVIQMKRVDNGCVDLMFSKRYLGMNHMKLEILNENIYLTSTCPCFRLPEKVRGSYNFEFDKDLFVHSRMLYCRVIRDVEENTVRKLIEEMTDIVLYRHLLILQASFGRIGQIPVRATLKCSGSCLSHTRLLIDIFGAGAIEIRVDTNTGCHILVAPWLSRKEIVQEQVALSKLSGNELITCLHKIVHLVFMRICLSVLGCNPVLSNNFAVGAGNRIIFSFAQNKPISINWNSAQVSQSGFFEALLNEKVSVLRGEIGSMLREDQMCYAQNIAIVQEMAAPVHMNSSGYWSMPVNSGSLSFTGRSFPARAGGFFRYLRKEIDNFSMLCGFSDFQESLPFTRPDPCYAVFHCPNGRYIHVELECADIMHPPESSSIVVIPPVRVLSQTFESVFTRSSILRKVNDLEGTLTPQVMRRMLLIYWSLSNGWRPIPHHLCAIYPATAKSFVLSDVFFTFLVSVTDNYEIKVVTRARGTGPITCFALSELGPVRTTDNQMFGWTKLQKIETLLRLQEVDDKCKIVLDALKWLGVRRVDFLADQQALSAKNTQEVLQISQNHCQISFDPCPAVNFIARRLWDIFDNMKDRLLFVKLIAGIIRMPNSSKFFGVFRLFEQLLEPGSNHQVNWSVLVRTNTWELREGFPVGVSMRVIVNGQESKIECKNEGIFMTDELGPERVTDDELLRRIVQYNEVPDDLLSFD